MHLHQVMRTTVDLDADLPETRRARPYAMPKFNLGRVREGVNLDRALDLVDGLEAAEIVPCAFDNRRPAPLAPLNCYPFSNAEMIDRKLIDGPRTTASRP